MYKKLSAGLVPSLLLASLGLTGCANLLYDSYSAPVYSSTQAKQLNQSTDNMSQSMTPVRPSMPTGTASIEQPNGPMTVVSQNANPYGNTQPAHTSGANPYLNNAPTAAGDFPMYTAGQTQIPTATTEVGMPADAQVPTVEGNVAPTAAAAQQNTASDAAAAVKQQVNSMVAEAQTSVKQTTGVAPKAITALLKEAQSAVAAGKYDNAASALERAHRIEPSNAKILYDIAQIRFAQGKYSQADSFASKAANLTQDSALSKKIWLLLANARKALGNMSAAQSAAAKAAAL